ncbi:MAG: class I SAM-dependent methyltransferase [Alphaproteobacteria bacterium]|nr:class I SAM-dependent methyltransferase [Alphaproteobacteria bacterium]
MSDEAAEPSRLSGPDYLDETLKQYEADPQKYSALWRKADPEMTWVPLRDLFHKPPCALADIAAGDGRDAQYFEKIGYAVTAVEPSKALRNLAQTLGGPASQVKWIDSALPTLAELNGMRFRMITVSAGFVHIKESDHKASLAALYRLSEKKGRVAISLRAGVTDPERLMFPSSPQDFAAGAAEVGFNLLRLLLNNPDSFRRDVFWNYLMLEHP